MSKTFCDRAALVVKRAENMKLIHVESEEHRKLLIDMIRIALDAEVLSGGPYLLKEIEEHDKR